MALTWQDWRGNDYTVGDTVTYPRGSGRSVEMTEAVILDLYEVWYRHDGPYRWVRLAEGELPPFKQEGRREDLDGNALGRDVIASIDYRLRRWVMHETDEREETKRRATLQPTKLSSRRFFREGIGRYAFEKLDEPRRVTLIDTENITVGR